LADLGLLAAPPGMTTALGAASAGAAAPGRHIGAGWTPASWPTSNVRTTPTAANDIAAVSETSAATPSPTVAVTSDGSSSAWPGPTGWRTVVAAIWGVLTFVCTVRLARSIAVAWRLHQGHTPCDDVDLHAALREACAIVG